MADLPPEKESMQTVASFKEIKKTLPHKFPFLLLDKAIEFEEYKRIVCLKNVTGNESFFVGHFPQEPVMPGVLIIETIAQASLLLMLLSRKADPQKARGKEIYVLGMVNRMRFFRPVFPGDQMKIEVEIVKALGKNLLVSGKVTVNEELVAQGDLAFGARKEE